MTLADLKKEATEYTATAARLLGRRGGKAAAGKGARARFAAMTPEERRALARKAVMARWAKARKRKSSG